MLVAAHSSQDASSMDTLATAYQTLVHSVLQRWSASFTIRIDPNALVAFIKSVLETLPSTSSAGSERSHDLVRFGELLVDLIWAVDSELDEIVMDAKALLSPEKKAESGDHEAEKAQTAEHAQKMSESDKDTLSLLLRNLVVCIFPQLN